MANFSQVEILRQGATIWNKWRKQHDELIIDLEGADLGDHPIRAYLRGEPVRVVSLAGVNLRGANLRNANLIGVDLQEADLGEANLQKANLGEANLVRADLRSANLRQAQLWDAQLRGAYAEKADLQEATLVKADLGGANLQEANLGRAILRESHLGGTNLVRANLGGFYLRNANLRGAHLRGARLEGADMNGANLQDADLEGADLQDADLREANLANAVLTRAILVRTKINQAKLSNCNVYGLSVWDLDGIPEEQKNLIITPEGDSAITVDDLEVAQFIYLLLKNEKLKNVIDTITSKVVLILGRFTEERKVVLDAIRDELRKYNFTPVVFDFDKPASKDLTGTVETLARMARFIIADLTDPSSIPHELATIIPSLRTTPVQPIRLKGSVGYTMFDDFQNDLPHRVLKTYEYKDSATIKAVLPEIIAPANEKAEFFRRKHREL